jgi:hypothetical protein
LKVEVITQGISRFVPYFPFHTRLRGNDGFFRLMDKSGIPVCRASLLWRKVGLALISESLRHPGVVAACVGQPDRPAGAALNAGYPDALDFLPEALPAFPAEQVLALFVL